MEAANGAATSPSQTDSSLPISGRKEGGSLSHVRRPAVAAAPEPRRTFSLSALFDRMRTRYATRSQRGKAATMIPPTLSDRESSHYRTLIDLVEANPRRKRPRVVVITDLAKDYDDLAAMVVLKELHRLRVVELVGFIANLMPSNKRTQFGRGALDLLDLYDVPIAQGTSGFPSEAQRKHNVLDYEFQCDFMVKDSRVGGEGGGETLLLRLCHEAQRSGEKLTLVLISSLEDIYTFSKKFPNELRGAVSNIVLQGGYTVTSAGKLEPDEAANNNRYDMEAAREFHAFIQNNRIESAVYTKVAAFATSLTSDLFEEMEQTGHELGKHLRKVQVEQDLSFYITASNTDPEKRFAKFMDQKWYLENKTSWFESNPPDAPYPEGKEVVKWLTKVIVYDALAALGASGADALDALKVLTTTQDASRPVHQIVGTAGNSGIDPDQMTSVLAALLKGSLIMTAPGQR